MTCQATVKEQIITILAERSGMEREAFTPDAILEDLNIDSLDRAEIAMCLEETFAIDISNQQEFALVTVGDVLKLVEAQL